MPSAKEVCTPATQMAAPKPDVSAKAKKVFEVILTRHFARKSISAEIVKI